MFEIFVIIVLILICISIVIIAIRQSKLQYYNPNPLIGGGLKGRVNRMIFDNRVKKASKFSNIAKIKILDDIWNRIVG